MYLLTPAAERPEDYDAFVSQVQAAPSGLNHYQILSVNKNDDGAYTASVNTEFSSPTGGAIKSESQYKIVLEKDIYKIEKIK